MMVINEIYTFEIREKIDLDGAMIYNLIVQWIGEDHLFISFYILNVIFGAIAYKLGFAKIAAFKIDIRLCDVVDWNVHRLHFQLAWLADHRNVDHHFNRIGHLSLPLIS